MNYLKIFLAGILFFVLQNTFAQNKLVLQKRSDPKKQIQIGLNAEFVINTVHGTYISNKIWLSDTVIKILAMKHVRDSIYFEQGPESGKPTSVVQPIYLQDTIAIPFSDILWLRKYRFKTKTWDRVIGGIGIVALTGFLTLHIIDEAKEKAKEEGVNQSDPQIENTLLGVIGLCLITPAINRKYDLVKKWTIVKSVNGNKT